MVVFDGFCVCFLPLSRFGKWHAIMNHVKVFKGKHLGSWNYYFHVEKLTMSSSQQFWTHYYLLHVFCWFTWKNVLQAGRVQRGNRKNGELSMIFPKITKCTQICPPNEPHRQRRMTASHHHGEVLRLVPPPKKKTHFPKKFLRPYYEIMKPTIIP